LQGIRKRITPDNYNNRIAVIAVVIRVLLGVVFLVSAVAKGSDLVRFGRQIEMVLGVYDGVASVGQPAAFTLAILLVLAELVVSAALITGYRARQASVASVLILIGFIGVLVVRAKTGIAGDCGCFGAFFKRSPTAALFEDGVLLVAAIIVYVSPMHFAARRFWLATPILIGGLIPTLYFAISPPIWAVLRTGSSFPYLANNSLFNTNDSHLVWLLEPNCHGCQDKMPLINSLATAAGFPPVTAVSHASPGRLTEFKYDFNPDFPIQSVSTRDWERIFLPSGALLYIKNGCVARIFRPGHIPDQLENLKELIGK